MKNENPTEDKKKSKVICVPLIQAKQFHELSSWRMLKQQRNLLLDQGHPYPTPTILSVWQGPVLLFSLELIAAGLRGLQAMALATVFV